MKERPILFSAEMVKALLAGRKTQTRRILTPQPDHLQHHEYRGNLIYEGEHRMWCWKGVVVDNIWDFQNNEDRRTLAAACPYGQPEDRLWVRETWTGTWHPTQQSDLNMHIAYAADGSEGFRHAPEGYALPKAAAKPSNWVTPLFMPRWASRIALEITEVRVQRLQEINDDDAIAEGIEVDDIGHYANYLDREDDARIGNWLGPKGSYATLWNAIHGPGSWKANPWCWSISFRRVASAS